MPTINPTVAHIGNDTVRFTYTPMANADVGAPIGANHADYADRNVSVFGTFGAGGTVLIQGANDAALTYHTLNDQSDNALSITTAKNEQIEQVPEHTRPNVSAGDGATALTVVITCRRERSQRA